MLATSPVSAQLPEDLDQDAGGVLTEPADDETYERYVFASFHGGDDGGRNGEQIWLSVSKGNDPLNWYELNYDEGTSLSQPILQTVNPPQGQMGLRDPSLIRSADGEKFYLLATDLKTFEDGQSWSYRQSRGSRNLVVYESEDLVNWSDARFVKVEDDHAGNVWAPEAFYDANSGQYIVFWASNLYPNTDIDTRNTSQISYNRIRIATTTDFVTFSEPTTWVNLDRSTGQQGWGMIDSTMIATDDRVYRLTKDENGFRVLLQYIDSLDDLHDTWGHPETMPYVTNRIPISPLTLNPNAWTMVGNPNGSSKWQIPGLNGGNLEGPLVFKDNVEDMWYVFIDYASGGGYVAWRSDSMDRPPNQWEYLGQSWCNITGRSTSCNAVSPTSPYWSLPVSPRHGSVLPITLEEWEGLMAGFNSPVHVEASLVKADGTAVAEDEWLNEEPELKVDWADFNGTDLSPAWLRLIEGHNGGPRMVGSQVTSGIAQGMTVPVNAAEGTNWAQVEYRDASLGGDAVMLWTTEVPYKLDTTPPTLVATVDAAASGGLELTVSASDPLPTGAAENSGLASCQYRVGDGPWVDCEPTVAVPSWTFVTVLAIDNAGNESTVILGTAPSVTKVTLGPASVVQGAPVLVTATVSALRNRDAVPLPTRDVRITVAGVEHIATLEPGEEASVATLNLPTLIGLLAVTGMRAGEAVGADVSDLNLNTGALTVRGAKFGKSRLLPLHPSTTDALGAYLRVRAHHGATTAALLVSTAGTRLTYDNAQRIFKKLTARAGIMPRSGACRPRLHDLRHTFAVNSLLDAYDSGADPGERLPLLSTYLGHTEPANTYWYLHACPELLAAAANRVDHHLATVTR